MRSKLGVLCMALGALMLAVAMAMFVSNRVEEQHASEAVDSLMPQIVQRIEDNLHAETTAAVESEAAVTTAAVETDLSVPETTVAIETLPPLELPEPVPQKMTVGYIDGYGYIGYLSLPTLSLELPIMDEWDYDRLKMTPCRFSGTTYGDDLVIAGHDYNRHFAPLRKLAVGDGLSFTDMNGRKTAYTVVALDVLSPYALEDMTAGEYDLTLFTCTYDGKNRYTVRCDRVEE